MHDCSHIWFLGVGYLQFNAVLKSSDQVLSRDSFVRTCACNFDKFLFSTYLLNPFAYTKIYKKNKLKLHKTHQVPSYYDNLTDKTKYVVKYLPDFRNYNVNTGRFTFCNKRLSWPKRETYFSRVIKQRFAKWFTSTNSPFANILSSVDGGSFTQH